LPETKILVCAGSNSACDEIGDRLLKYIPEYQLYRFYSGSLIHYQDRISKKLIPLSNIRRGEYEKPTASDFRNCRVIISTLVNAGHLEDIVSSSYFSFIIIDECASAAEAHVCIPIGLAVSGGELSASIVLLGDPRQLGPVMNDHQSEK
jgi:helicase MOV-10